MIAIVIPSFHALGLNNLIYEKNIIRKDNLVLCFVYMLLSTPYTNIINEWIISFSMLFVLNYIFSSYQKKFPFSQIFNISIIISVLSFISPNILLLSFFIIISSITYNQFNWRNLSVSFIGVCLPYFFYFFYTILFEKPFYFPEFNDPHLIKDLAIFSFPKLIWCCVILLVSCCSFIELFKWLYKKSIRSRKSFLVIFLYLILIFVFLVFNILQSWYLLMTPLCIIIGNYFTYTKHKKTANFLFILLVLSSFYYKCNIGL
tara:strand:+ start:2230 stop:3009 length:780 start_codon:yes stop_codon:yes gene_type:complete